MARPLNFRNSANSVNFVSIQASDGSSMLTDSGIVDFTGKISTDPCFIKNGRLLPSIDSTNNTTITCNISNNNNFHIETTANLSVIDITNPIIGQSGHIIIKNTDANTHSITWKLNGSASSNLKWKGGSAPTLSTTSGYIDLISYYVVSTTCILLCPATEFYS